MEPTVVFLLFLPAIIFGVWVFFNPEVLLEWEPGVRNVELNNIGRTREQIGGLLLVFLPLVSLVVIGAGIIQLIGFFGVIAISAYWFS